MRLIRPSAPTSLTITGPVLESLPTYSGGTTYGLGDRVLVTDGTTGFVYIYESASAGNTGHSTADPAWWLFVSAANPYRMFDQVASSQTTSATGSIYTAFIPVPLASTVTLLNVLADTARVQVLVSASLVYDKTVSLTSAGSGVADWYQYFFGDFAKLSNVLFTDLPSYTGQEIRVTLTGGVLVALGTLGVGYGYDLGTTLTAKVGIDDYSRKTPDAFGNFTVTERAYAKNGSFTSAITIDRFDEIATILPLYRATPAIWIGDDDLGSTYIFGFYKLYSIQSQEEPLATIQLDIEGLT